MAEHKNAKILRAIADNADVIIQYKDNTGQWNDCFYYHLLCDEFEYRIKPTIVKKWKWVYAIWDCGHEYEVVTEFLSEAQFMDIYNAKSMVWYQKIDATMREDEE